jgi:hypothetical protein
MSKQITDITIDLDRWGYVNASIFRGWPGLPGFYSRSYSGYGNLVNLEASAFRRLQRVQAMQLTLFKRNQEPQQCAKNA